MSVFASSLVGRSSSNEAVDIEDWLEVSGKKMVWPVLVGVEERDWALVGGEFGLDSSMTSC